MFISLQQLEQRPVPFKVEIPAGEIEFDNKIVQASGLKAEGSARLINHALGEIRIEGSVQVTMHALCDRCLEPTVFPIKDQFDLVYMPAEEASAGEDEVDEAAIEVGFYEGNGLALNDVLREVVLLDLPMQFICSEDCKGICPVCGQNRNQTACKCQAQAEDDRWSKLKAFRAEISPQN